MPPIGILPSNHPHRPHPTSGHLQQTHARSHDCFLHQHRNTMQSSSPAAFMQSCAQQPYLKPCRMERSTLMAMGERSSAYLVTGLKTTIHTVACSRESPRCAPKARPHGLHKHTLFRIYERDYNERDQPTFRMCGQMRSRGIKLKSASCLNKIIASSQRALASGSFCRTQPRRG